MLRMQKGLLFFLLIAICLCLPGLSYGQNTNVSNGIIFDGEPYLAINPGNPQHLVVAWMSYINAIDLYKIKTRASFDGGQTWGAVAELPHTVTGYSSADPSLAFNNAGDVFACYIDFTGTNPPVTGGVYLCKSTNGGTSWEPPTEVINTNFDGTKWPIDRPWLQIDQSATSSQGTIYVTTFNLNRNNPSYRPYLSVSNDNGVTFSTTYVDGTGYLAGSLNPLPMCTHAIAANGTWYGGYPSFMISQSLFLEVYLASSTDGGITIQYQDLHTNTDTASIASYNLAKKGPLLLSNPADPDHLAYIFLRAVHNDPDVFFKESRDGGANWSIPVRLNDDPIGNDRQQDLIWGDFDQDGDLVIGWRDRRNGTDSTYKTSSEIWATFRHRDSLNFAPNFPVSSQVVPHDTVLEFAGNDFMCIQLVNDTLHAVWGDVRTGKLNIWYSRMDVNGTLLFAQPISSESLPTAKAFPNPFTDRLKVKSLVPVKQIEVTDTKGNLIISKRFEVEEYEFELGLPQLPSGTYLLRLNSPSSQMPSSVLKIIRE